MKDNENIPNNAPDGINEAEPEENAMGELHDGVEAENESDEPKGETLSIGKRLALEIFDWVEIGAIALAAVVIMFTFLMKIVIVDGNSMERTLHDGDFLTVSNLFYNPKQGDIVVIQVPGMGDHAPIIKRVIATEGQVIDIDFDAWEVSVDGVALDEPYVNYMRNMPMLRGDAKHEYPLTVAEGKVFVLGDNRNNSADSRDPRIQEVDVKNVFGRVLIRLFPKFGTVKPDA